MYVPLVHLPATLVSCSGDPADGSRAVVIPCDRGRTDDRDDGREEQGVERGWLHVVWRISILVAVFGRSAFTVALLCTLNENIGFYWRRTASSSSRWCLADMIADERHE
jgi:hypothetical protein